MKLANSMILLTLSLLLNLSAAPAQSKAFDSQRINEDRRAWVDVSQGLGIPLGGLGTGYSVFGKFGFVYVNFDNIPDNEEYQVAIPGKTFYEQEPKSKKAGFGFILEADEKDKYVLQTTAASWAQDARPFKDAKAKALLPQGTVDFFSDDLKLQITVDCFTPLIQHDVKISNTPAQIFDITVVNPSSSTRMVTLGLVHAKTGKARGEMTVFELAHGQIAFAAEGGQAGEKGVSVKMALQPNSRATKRFIISWYYPEISGQGNLLEIEYRLYTEPFRDAGQVIEFVMKNADGWKQRIQAWQDSYDVPGAFKRLWFSSLTSVMTSTILTQKHFYEVETPHDCLNTMDVNVYSNWVYMVNWPELELRDMKQYLSRIETEGDNKGFVLHHLWNGRSHYVEEPTFLVRFFRDYIWYNDPSFLETGYPLAELAANHVYRVGNYKYLISSNHGNQSYDCWKMPGVGVYVNSPWIYGLYAMEELSVKTGKEFHIDGIPVSEFKARALESFNAVLWNDKNRDWDAYYLLPDSNKAEHPDAVFSDQLFGYWVIDIYPGAKKVLDEAKVKAALQTIYTNNVLEDAPKNFRGWTNGRMPDGSPVLHGGEHAQTCWFGAQINLASLFGLTGNEEASLDVFASVESSLNNYHLAAGEWNKIINEKGRADWAWEIGKDTPRFPPYPRYKSSWEYLIRILGLQMDEKNFYIHPFTMIDFNLNKIQLAGTEFSVKVEKGWNRVFVNGKVVDNPNALVLPRNVRTYTLAFMK